MFKFTWSSSCKKGETIMRIGVDIDGTLTDIAKFQIEEGKKFLVENQLIQKSLT